MKIHSDSFAQGQPIPVEVTETLIPPTFPVKVLNSRLKAISFAPSKCFAIISVRLGSFFKYFAE